MTACYIIQRKARTGCCACINIATIHTNGGKSRACRTTNRIAYRGTAPALNDLVGGQVDYGCDQIVNLVSQIEGNNIKAMGIATKERSPVLKGVPTTAEGGLPQFEVSAWNALFAPKDLPKDIADKLVAALDKALDDEGTRKRLLDLGSVLPDKAGRTPAALQTLVESEVARWTPVLKAAGN